jgi:erythromycin esterase-like protein
MHKLNIESELNALLNDIGDAPIVMLGEATHGTHEFYSWRTALSKRLIKEKGFNFIAVEGDWPDCYRVNRFIKDYKSIDQAGPQLTESVGTLLKEFNRWPTWMWANWEVAALVEWLHEYNGTLTPDRKIGFYGLDVYSLWDSMREMMHYLEKEDPEAAKSVKKAIQCFEPYEGKEQLYARYSLTEHSCRDKVLGLLREVRMKAQLLDGDREAGFNTEQNALIAVNAEKYYRSMMNFDNESWNVRDRHMMETLDRLLQFHGKGAKAIVWAHNTHIGDASATGMKRAGMINIGQLARENYGVNKVYLAGFGTYSGSVIAAEEWGAPMQEMEVPPAREGSIEHQLHTEDPLDRYLLLQTEDQSSQYEREIRHRAVGVVYNPENDRFSNYVPSVLSLRYDAFIFIDETSAVHPLHLQPHDVEMPATYPFGF